MAFWQKGLEEAARRPRVVDQKKKNYSDDLSQREGEEKQLKLGRRLRLHGSGG